VEVVSGEVDEKAAEIHTRGEQHVEGGGDGLKLLGAHDDDDEDVVHHADQEEDGREVEVDALRDHLLQHYSLKKKYVF
jgi:hypothetical protein